MNRDEKLIMKKNIRRLTNDDLRLFPIKDLVEGWNFKIDEITAGYYRVTGIDEWGRTVSRDGIDPEILLLACADDIKEIYT